MIGLSFSLALSWLSAMTVPKKMRSHYYLGLMNKATIGQAVIDLKEWQNFVAS